MVMTFKPYDSGAHKLPDQLQNVQNPAARSVCKAEQYDHIHPLLQNRSRLSVSHHIIYKISIICLHFPHWHSLRCLSAVLQPCTPTRQLPPASDSQHAALWATMKKYNISTNLIRVIKNLYNKATSAVLFNSSIGD